MARFSGTQRLWVTRGAIALGAGIVVGIACGVAAVKAFQSPVTITADTTVADTTRKKPASRAAGASDDAEKDNAPTQAAARESVTVVPKLIGLEEGDARQAIERAGFTVGSILFRSSAEPVGTVLSSFPVPGEHVPLPATINLVLSDGKPAKDTLSNSPQPSSHPRS